MIPGGDDTLPEDRGGLRDSERVLPRVLHRLREISLVRTAHFAYRTGCRRAFVYPRVHVGLEDGIAIRAGGFLHLGRRWGRGGFLRRNSTFIVVARWNSSTTSRSTRAFPSA